uniref:Uncharacterized protein n=1 Tax=Denticeps clupeoides TaxID=299321 RepID=A0AAY4DI32_9TELE
MFGDSQRQPSNYGAAALSARPPLKKIRLLGGGKAPVPASVPGLSPIPAPRSALLSQGMCFTSIFIHRIKEDPVFCKLVWDVGVAAGKVVYIRSQLIKDL